MIMAPLFFGYDSGILLGHQSSSSSSVPCSHPKFKICKSVASTVAHRQVVRLKGTSQVREGESVCGEIQDFVPPDMNQFITHQHKDKHLLEIIERLSLPNTSTCSLNQNFVLKDGLLKRVQGSKKLPVVPETLRHEVITHYHSSPTCPHFGIRKTVGKIQEKFWWKNMRRDVMDFIKRCRQCQLSKPVYEKPQGFMLSTSSQRPWEVLAMDLLGPFPESEDGNIYILVVTDHFSKYSLIYLLKRATGRVLASLLRQIYCMFGAPKMLVSDNGPQMISSHVSKICCMWGVRRIFTVPYHPQSNWVERVNRNLVSMLCCFVGRNHSSWDKYVYEFMYALNSFKHDATGFSPAELFFGRTLGGPGEWMVLEDTVDKGDGWTSFVGGGGLDSRFAQARANMVKQNKRNKLLYDCKRAGVGLSVGDQVMLRSHPLSNLRRNFSAKLAPKWRGPYVIRESLSPVNFCIEGEHGEFRVAHVDQLKLIK